MEDDDRVAAWRALLLAHSGATRAIEAQLVDQQLIPLGWYDVLLELSGAPSRRLRMQDLGRRVLLSRTRVSRQVDEMEGAGLVVREPDLDDGRASLAVLTPAGKAALRKAAPRYLAAIEEQFTGLLTDEERRVLITALGRVADHHAAGNAR